MAMNVPMSELLKRPVSELIDENKMPKKRFFRTRAHCNPLSYNDGFDYPVAPSDFDWKAHFPNIPEEDRVVTVLDIGMGFGGLTVSLATSLPDKLVLGMEIRAKVTTVVYHSIIRRKIRDVMLMSFSLSIENVTLVFTACRFVQVCEYVRLRIDALRNEFPGQYQNSSCLRYSILFDCQRVLVCAFMRCTPFILL